MALNNVIDIFKEAEKEEEVQSWCKTKTGVNRVQLPSITIIYA
jgi:hypothetical protein